MDFSKEVLDQIYGKKEELQAEQDKLQTVVAEAQAKMEKNAEDISACEHLLARCGYVVTIAEKSDDVGVEQSYQAVGVSTIQE